MIVDITCLQQAGVSEYPELSMTQSKFFVPKKNPVRIDDSVLACVISQLIEGVRRIEMTVSATVVWFGSFQGQMILKQIEDCEMAT